MEGAPIRRPRPLLQRQTVISDTPLTVQFTTEETETRPKLSGQKSHTVSAFHRSGKENQEKKRQLTCTAEKRDHEVRVEVQDISSVRRSCRSMAYEQPLVGHTEPQKKARRLGSSRHVNRTTLVPRSFSFTLSPLHSTSETKPHRVGISRSFLPQTNFEPQQRIPTRVFPSFQGPLPSLEVFRLRPNIVTETTVCRNSAFTSHPRIHKRQLYPQTQRQGIAVSKRDYT